MVGGQADDPAVDELGPAARSRSPRSPAGRAGDTAFASTKTPEKPVAATARARSSAASGGHTLSTTSLDGAQCLQRARVPKAGVPRAGAGGGPPSASTSTAPGCRRGAGPPPRSRPCFPDAGRRRCAAAGRRSSGDGSQRVAVPGTAPVPAGRSQPAPTRGTMAQLGVVLLRCTKPSTTRTITAAPATKAKMAAIPAMRPIVDQA